MNTSNSSSIVDFYEQIDILSFISSKKNLKVIFPNSKSQLLISPKNIIKILSQSEISLYEDITKLINFSINFTLKNLFSKEELIWMKIPSYKIYFGIFGFNFCNLEGKEIIKISSMIFSSYQNMAPYIKVSLIKNSSIYLSKSNTFRSLYSERNVNNSLSLIKNELTVSSNIVNNTSVELIDVHDILGNNHKIFKEQLDFVKEQLYLEKINLNNVIINFFDYPNNKLFSIHKKFLVKEKLILPNQKKHYIISVAKIKMKNNKK